LQTFTSTIYYILVWTSWKRNSFAFHLFIYCIQNFFSNWKLQQIMHGYSSQ